MKRPLLTNATVSEKVQITPGQSITWVNPTTAGEPHTVTFVLDNKTTTGVVSALGVPNGAQFTPIPPGSDNQPVMMPIKSVVIALNARSYIPTIIDSHGNVKMFAPPNAKYTLSGTEKYVNSGWILFSLLKHKSNYTQPIDQDNRFK